MLTPVLFLSDLDGTWLSKNPQNRAQLDAGVQRLRDEYREQGIDLQFGYITARPPARVAQEHLPQPDWTVTFNGGWIHPGVANGPQLEAWENRNKQSGFTAQLALDTLQGLLQQPAYRNLKFHTVGQVVKNPAADECPYVSSLCFDQSSIALTPNEQTDANHNGQPDLFETDTYRAPQQIQNLMNDLSASLARRGVQFQMSPAYLFSGMPYVMLDVGSPVADKGNAVAFLADLKKIPASHVIVAGDGGNDIAMMRALDGSDDGRRAIVVGCDPNLHAAASKLQNAIIAPADEDSSLAVLAGLSQHLAAIKAQLSPNAA
jgi:hydroxymethylpyrimidine pyrophosphatase-like HAD family hydrolase